jgi:type I restriction enzyme S subunit
MSEWKEIPIKEIVIEHRPVTYGIVQPGPDIRPNGIPLIRGKDYSSGKVDTTDLYHVKPEIDLPYKRSKVLGNDILFSIAGYVGQVAVVPKSLEGANITQTTARISVDSKLYNSEYIFYYLISQFVQIQVRKFSKGSAQEGLNLSDVEKIKLKCPFYPEQRKIAQILSICDIVIEKSQAAIAKYRAIKQGMLYDLFTRGIDINTGKLRPKYKDAPELYKESKLGIVPVMWEVERLESLTEKIGSGVTPTGGSEVYKSFGVLFLRSQNVLIGSLSIEDAAFITNEIDERMEGSRVKPFDVLLNITGASIGRCAYFPIELKSANVNQHVCIIRFKNISKSLAIFASEFMNSVFGQSQINRSNAGGNRDGLNFQQIKSFHFPVLEGSELEKISEVIETQNQKLFTEQAYLQKVQQIKTGLMDDLLSGKKEVNVKDKKEVLNG